jgi:hypothetical protein
LRGFFEEAHSSKKKEEELKIIKGWGRDSSVESRRSPEEA